MEIFETDIGKKVAVVTHEELLQVVSSYYYKQLAFRHQLTVLRRGCRGCKALIEYDSLPERIKQRYDKLHPTAYTEAMMLKREEEMAITIHPDIRRFFANYRTASGTALPPDVQRQYCTNATVLLKMLEGYNQTTAMRKAGGSRVAPYNWKSAKKIAEYYADVTTLPRKETTLRRMLNGYKTEGLVVLVDKKFGNTRTKKFTDETIERLIALKRQRKPVLTNHEIFEEYERTRERFNLPELSEKTVVNLLYRPAVKAL